MIFLFNLHFINNLEFYRFPRVNNRLKSLHRQCPLWPEPLRALQTIFHLRVPAAGRWVVHFACGLVDTFWFQSVGKNHNIGSKTVISKIVMLNHSNIFRVFFSNWKVFFIIFITVIIGGHKICLYGLDFAGTTFS